jgi:hypothetical protein
VGLIEQRAHFWIFGEHHAVEVSDQCLATAFQQRHSGFDDGTVLGAKHKVTPGQQGFSTFAVCLSVSMPIFISLQINNLTHR